MRIPLPRRVVRSRGAVVAPLFATALVVGLLPAVVAVAPAAAAAAVPPGPANTGVPNGTPLHRVDGLLVLDRPGATYRNLDVHGRVKVTAPNVTLANSIVRGDASNTLGSLVDCNDPKTRHDGFVLRDSTLVAEHPSIYQMGIMGHDFTVLRTEITNTLDGVHVVGGRVTVSRSWIHDTRFIPASQSPNHQDTHNDGVQVIAGSNVVIDGNTIERNSNAGLMVGQSSGVVSGLRFTGNWSSGGACTVNIVAVPRATIGGLTVSGTRFKHNTRVANCAILQNHGVTMALGGNVWQDTGGAVALTRGQ